ncbi:hypothetical protein CC80DRAFT_584583 [Byssothecium circinans]|uniref:Uncharacterized protein n=1 Tax=Byssothecium circinans TaxID=147558 RepID=A0A6A5U5A4_9PLEO|nr:hypothetical protein CC80DRAFT_584583 [Byssothecium circinans]
MATNQQSQFDARMAVACLESGRYEEFLENFASALVFYTPAYTSTPTLLPLHLHSIFLTSIAPRLAGNSRVLARAPHIFDTSTLPSETEEKLRKLLTLFATMPEPTKKRNAPGATKGKNMSVFISGFRGLHPIDVGIAYYYRGHDLYGPSRNPIMPVSFATKREIMIVELASDCAPAYDPNDPTLQDESKVMAFYKSKVSEWERRTVAVETTNFCAPEAETIDSPVEGVAEQQGVSEQRNVGKQQDLIAQQGVTGQQDAYMKELRPLSSRQPSFHAQGLDPTYVQALNELYGNDARYLAASVPHSRSATPYRPSNPWASSGTGSGPFTSQATHLHGPTTKRSGYSTGHSTAASQHGTRPLHPQLSRGNTDLDRDDPFDVHRLTSLMEEYAARPTPPTVIRGPLSSRNPSSTPMTPNYLLSMSDRQPSQTTGQYLRPPVSLPLSRIASMSAMANANNNTDGSQQGSINVPGRSVHRSLPQEYVLPGSSSMTSAFREPVAVQLSRPSSVDPTAFEDGDLFLDLRPVRDRTPTPHPASQTRDERALDPMLFEDDDLFLQPSENHESPPFPSIPTEVHRLQSSRGASPMPTEEQLLANGPGPTLTAAGPSNAPPPTHVGLPVQGTIAGARTAARPRGDSMKSASLALNTALRTHAAAFSSTSPFARSPSPFPSLTSSSATARPGTSVLKCPLHGDECDGQTVTEPHVTARTNAGRGFKEVVPSLTEGGRTMVDWKLLLVEEKVKKAGKSGGGEGVWMVGWSTPG